MGDSAPAVAMRLSASMPSTPQCQHVMTRRPNAAGHPSPERIARQRAKLEDRGMNPDLCCQRSSYVVDGRHYCGNHAGMAALDALVTSGAARQIAICS